METNKKQNLFTTAFSGFLKYTQGVWKYATKIDLPQFSRVFKNSPEVSESMQQKLDLPLSFNNKIMVSESVQ